VTILESALRDAIAVDFNAEIVYGNDQIDLCVPRRFATVNFYLMQTDALTRCVDEMRMKLGYKPVMIQDGASDYDLNGWYDFYISINDFDILRIDAVIECFVINSQEPDNETEYLIHLSEIERATIYDIINDQCRKCVGKSCEDLLAESRKELEELIEYEKRMGSI